MDGIVFLSTEDIYTYHLLDEGYMGGLLNKGAGEVFEALASKMKNINSTYYSLHNKGERTPAEEELYKKCFSNLVLEASMRIWNRSDQVLIADYKNALQDSDSDPVYREALRAVIKRKGLEIPEEEKTNNF